MVIWLKLARFATIETEDFILRPFRFEDHEDFFAIASNPNNLRFIFPAQLNEEECQLFLVHYFMKEPLGIWAIEEKKTHRLIGCIRFENLNVTKGTTELGYFIHQDYWGKGIIPTILPNILWIAFQACQLKQVSIIAHEENTASRRVAEKTGFTLTRRFKGSDRYTHKMRNYVQYDYQKGDFRL